jgi:hypothetical protein
MTTIRFQALPGKTRKRKQIIINLKYIIKWHTLSTNIRIPEQPKEERITKQNFPHWLFVPIVAPSIFSILFVENAAIIAENWRLSKKSPDQRAFSRKLLLPQ